MHSTLARVALALALPTTALAQAPIVIRAGQVLDGTKGANRP